MMKTALAVAAALTLAACSPEDDVPDWPRVELLYAAGADVTCDGTSHQGGTPEGGPFTSYECAWEKVLVEGEPACWALVEFERASEGAPWGVTALRRSSATCY